MSSGSMLAEVFAPPGNLRREQRSQRRYPIALDMQYELRKQEQVVQCGSGRTLNISSGGILFQTNDPLPSSGEIDLALDWPFSLDQVCPLRLLARGQIVRSDPRGTAVRVLRHNFHTSKRRGK